jgi:hypothetical protein
MAKEAEEQRLVVAGAAGPDSGDQVDGLDQVPAPPRRQQRAPAEIPPSTPSSLAANLPERLRDLE